MSTTQDRLRQAARFTRLDADRELLTEAADALDRREAVIRLLEGEVALAAPGVPDDVVRDAQRYRWLRKSLPAGQGSLTVLLDDRCNGAFHKAVFMESLDASIDTAMLAASTAQKGGE